MQTEENSRGDFYKKGGVGKGTGEKHLGGFHIYFHPAKREKIQKLKEDNHATGNLARRVTEIKKNWELWLHRRLQ